MARKIFPQLIFILFSLVVTAYAGEKLDPFSAEFTIIPNNSSVWSDISVTLDFYIHNPGQGRLIGSKFICMEDIDSVTVTDGEGHRLPFTIKKYPRKRIIWEYAAAKQGNRRAKISFVMINAVKREVGKYLIYIDWIGGWNRQVLNATYSIVLPDKISEKDILYIFPKKYKFFKTPKDSKIVYSFPELNAKALKLTLKHKKPAKVRIQNKKGKSQKYIIKNIRFAPHDSTTDRLVFDLNKRTPYEVSHVPGRDKVEVSWKVPLEVADKVLKKKRIKTKLIKGLYWKKAGNKRMACIVQLRAKNYRIRYGTLENPPRAYIDVCADSKQRMVKKKKESTGKKKEIKEKASDKAKAVKLQKPELTEKVLLPAKTTTTTTTTIAVVEKEPPIEEKIAYRKIQKLFKLGDYLSAIEGHEKFLEKYPETVLKEEILFGIADSYQKLASEKDPKHYSQAIEAYKKMVVNFPESHRAPHAAFQIAECQRKRKFFIEAKSQYYFVVERYPESLLAIDARFWKAECLYQLRKFEDALKEFEKFIDDFPSGPHLKEVTFRIADCYVQIKDFDRAEFYYEKAMKRWPNLIKIPVNTLNNMAMTHYYKGKFDKCREIFFVSFNLHPSQDNRARLLRFIGDSYQWEAEMQKALNIYGNLITLFPESPEALIGIMRIADLGVNVSGLKSETFTFRDFNPYLSPEKVYRWVIENDKTGDLLTEAFYKLGFIQAEKGNYSKAVTFFKRSMYQKEKGVYYNKSFDNTQKILTKMINMASAKEDYFSVVELYKRNEDPFLKTIEDCSFLYNVGLGYLETGFKNKAEKIFKRILKEAETLDCKQKSLICLSRLDIRKGNPEKAEERLNILLYSRGSQVEPYLAEEAYHILGDAYFQCQKYQEAVKEYSIALKRQVNSFRHAKSLFRIGESFGKIGYYYNGIQFLKRMINIADQIHPERKEIKSYKDEAALLIGDYLFKKGNYNSAINVYKNLAKSTPDKEKKCWALLKCGEVLIKTGDYEGASKVFADVAEKMPYSFLGSFAQERIKEIELGKDLQPDLKRFL